MLVRKGRARTLVVTVTLVLNNDLLETVDESIATFLRELVCSVVLREQFEIR
jgi:hypothetical protein